MFEVIRLVFQLILPQVLLALGMFLSPPPHLCVAVLDFLCWSSTKSQFAPSCCALSSGHSSWLHTNISSPSNIRNLKYTCKSADECGVAHVSGSMESTVLIYIHLKKF